MANLNIPVARNKVLVADQTSPERVLVVNADGSINVDIVGGTVVVVPTSASTATNRSFTTTGAAVTQFAANTARLGWLIECPTLASLNMNADPIYVRLGAAAAADGTSFEVPAGASFPPAGSPLVSYTGLVSVFGVAGIKCSAVELSA